MNHEPDPQFIEHLKWQVRTAVQRGERFSTPVPRSGLHWLRTALLVTLSLLGGAGAVIAAERLQDERQKEFLVARARIEVEMAVLELEFARKSHARIEALASSGVISSEEIFEVSMRVDTATDLVQERRLDLEEIQLTGGEPRRDLGAPLAGGRDFVTEHLTLEVRRATHVLDPLRQRRARQQQLYEAGIVSTTELHAIEGELVIAEAALNWARQRLELRAGFIGGKHTLEQLQLLELEGEHAIAVSELTRRLAILQRRLEVERARAAEGSGPTPAGSELELQLLQKTLQLRQLELTRVRERLGN